MPLNSTGQDEAQKHENRPITAIFELNYTSMNKKVLLMILDGWGIATNKKVSAIDHDAQSSRKCGSVNTA